MHAEGEYEVVYEMRLDRRSSSLLERLSWRMKRKRVARGGMFGSHSVSGYCVASFVSDRGIMDTVEWIAGRLSEHQTMAKLVE